MSGVIPRTLRQYALLILLSPLFFSCANVGKATYFNNVQDSVFRKSEEMLDQPIAKNDVLSIAVTSLNPEASAIFNMPNLPAGSNFSAGNNSTLANSAGYIVNTDGEIHFPMLGRIKAEGLNKKTLADHISKQITDKKLLLDPIVSVRQLNFRVTVLGEVARPMVVTVPNEKINIMEAIGMAGDLTLFANRDNVLLIREEGGNRMVKRIDLTAPATLNSPYYYLRSGDIVYAEANKTKVSTTSQGRQVLPIVMSALSVAVIALDRILR